MKSLLSLTNDEIVLGVAVLGALCMLPVLLGHLRSAYAARGLAAKKPNQLAARGRAATEAANAEQASTRRKADTSKFGRRQ